VLEIAAADGMVVRERNFTLSDVYNAEEAFVTGTFAGLSPVREVDGRQIGDGQRGEVVKHLQGLHRQRVAEYVRGPGREHPRAG
jgi:branched-chain amino acid aminotransferase